ncbi:sigma-70 family RNA polymerase sigma factor [Mariprofundus erugo]|uniref:RNA polymerase sigma factor n=1 Tax=Mariprofundus erugo TaxID=2528639 RepID=A0A5R9GND5_9PROT|nr:RNA polymerase factor sigma-32 [Mariprofundus erugo]TLS67871.1 sigma-70 family RNA polymerase sigma factor [Mariprofundus erugo]TLS73613.1 sigma-70 family RNA polymerase sigma factor [Mariprofundus erugo]
MSETRALKALTSLDRFYQELRKIPRLDREEEEALARKWQRDHDLASVQQLINANLHVVAAIAREYRHFGLPEEDLIQEGTLGLMQAVKRFDPDRGFRLKTYAAYWIRASIHDFILNSWSIVKMGTNKLQRRIFAGLQKAECAIAALEGRDLEAVAEQHGTSGESYQAIAASFLRRDFSIDSDATEEGAVIELPAPDDSPEQLMEEQEWQSFTRTQLKLALDQLPERDRYIIRQRHLIEPPVTLKELSVELGVSIERIRQIEARAMEKIAQSCSDLVTWETE